VSQSNDESHPKISSRVVGNRQGTNTARKVVSLYWKNEDGTAGGPIGEVVAKAIEQGYANKAESLHGYFYAVLKALNAIT
jgi:hypothetical protein